ncbi:hypothetical protein Gotur_032218 [Gossypium turneri]
MGFVDDMKKYKKELEDTWGEVSKLWEENMVLRGRGKHAKERCNRFSEEVKNMYKKEHRIMDLRSKNCKLENEKAKAKSFEELDKRVSCLKTSFNTLQDEDNSNNNEIVGKIEVSKNGRLKPVEVNGYAPNVETMKLKMGDEEDSVVTMCNRRPGTAVHLNTSSKFAYRAALELNRMQQLICSFCSYVTLSSSLVICSQS